MISLNNYIKNTFPTLILLFFSRANIVDESYVKLSDSRGIENNQHKLFMRMSGKKYREKRTYK